MTEKLTTIADFQQYIHDRYYETDRARGTSATFLWFIEEVGELATALHGEDKGNLQDEFADVLAWLCTLANINDVDITEAIHRKYVDNGGPDGHK